MSPSRRASYSIVIKLIVLMWLGFILSLVYPNLAQFGLYPREMWGLIGIFTSPFIHGGWNHLIANTTGMIIFGIIFSWVARGATGSIVLYMMVVQGLLTWIFAREGNHVGASGLVFGLFSYLIFIGFFERKFKHILVSMAVMILWGGTIVGVLPLSPFISWEAHLFGFVAGFFAAKYGLPKT
ncbi:rhomboid family intramembrane serine protease [Pseudobacteriovorax antillogorgiicola]|uniref:Rhomboid family protein n=1 Tax=Pseudobacteriovorax antillogorgiicola TaxID=1513793 RepID=A0A1Y6CKE6_9BACT|nr:rhomboid family intramembrane serine protease [Pseudobacteriovorax antillogorgiicola]TCS45633.1 rhomboid family protein [Pseudobacteriovorax antillogorgiicola]SMF72652.1 Rhomboid family protein [Pseudobacteriovorax antillogorgiicola]